MNLLILAFTVQISFCLTSDELKTESVWVGKILSPISIFKKVQASWNEVNVRYISAIPRVFLGIPVHALGLGL